MLKKSTIPRKVPLDEHGAAVIISAGGCHSGFVTDKGTATLVGGAIAAHHHAHNPRACVDLRRQLVRATWAWRGGYRAQLVGACGHELERDSGRGAARQGHQLRRLALLSANQCDTGSCVAQLKCHALTPVLCRRWCHVRVGARRQWAARDWQGVAAEHYGDGPPWHVRGRSTCERPPPQPYVWFFVCSGNPRRVKFAEGSSPVVQVDCGAFHTAAVTADGSLFTWGKEDHGMLGLHHGRDMHTPSRVDLPKAATYVTLGVAAAREWRVTVVHGRWYAGTSHAADGTPWWWRRVPSTPLGVASMGGLASGMIAADSPQRLYVCCRAEDGIGQRAHPAHLAVGWPEISGPSDLWGDAQSCANNVWVCRGMWPWYVPL